MENQGTPNKATNPKQGDDDFSQMLDQFQATVGSFEKDQLVSGKIISMTDREILIELGAKSEGIVYGKDIEALPKDVRSALKVGDEVYGYVVTPEDQNGNVVLSMSKAISERDWRTAEELFEKQEAIEAMIAGFNKGGVIIKVGRLRGFVPASQLSLTHQRMMGEESQPPEQRFQKLVGQKALIKVIEIDRERNRLILSERAASKEARAAQKDKLMSSIEVGQQLEGIVSSVKEFGVFVDLGGADGMIHLTELSHTRVKHPSDVVKEGDKVKVKVINVEKETGRIGLSLKALAPDPWSQVAKKYKPGQLLEAEVIKVHPKHGVFARLKDDEAIEGLIPLSELSDKQVNNPREVVKEGQMLTLRVLRVEPEARRIALSLRRVNRPEYADADWQAEMAESDADSPDDAESSSESDMQ
jgi:small subunit ribosomal protein S1